MFELAYYVLIDPNTASESTLRSKVIAIACSFAVLVLAAYFYVAVQMGLSTNDYARCASVYTATEYFTSILFFLVSVSLTVAYSRLRGSINKCVFHFDRATTQNIEILFRFLVTSFLLQTVYLIWWAA